jgi:hypothetical protein
MRFDEQPRIAEQAGITSREAIEEFEGPSERPVGIEGPWDSAAVAEELCEQILARQPGMSERELWRALAAYGRNGMARSGRLDSALLASCNREKLRDRIRMLIGRLPAQSLDEFCGLVAFTETFLSRAEFLCDLVVYLFTEREKGLRPEGTPGRLYVQFFVQKLMWELDVVSRIGEQRPLSALDDEYADWLSDRILDGEVLI